MARSERFALPKGWTVMERSTSGGSRYLLVDHGDLSARRSHDLHIRERDQRARFWIGTSRASVELSDETPVSRTPSDARHSDQKLAITRGFSFSEAFGVGGWWDSSGRIVTGC